ncbi:lysine N(6)-hydroxylase/L-ornithine N(5)-oxygenase family protein [Longispora albida]|uniref:lysine N(6)-hydroxylase/L-ornithine N(5)-oxygenase family protein n=1 Tax=Longispora albida TaxID=203523 RepID=UPI00036F1335|nr:SidA/IucD/PvdA family monooxygenase [Longispora albida]
MLAPRAGFAATQSHRGEMMFDLVGAGFGPSNLALAVALTEHNAHAEPDETVIGHFLERQAQFGWHRGMLIDDATMQVSFLKDLVTLRNPSSEFSFLCYLQSKGRLVDFINHKSLFPLRVEFHDYFAWAAEQVSAQVSYGTDVTCVRPVRSAGGRITALDVHASDAAGERVLRTRNVVLGTGLRARLPEGVTEGERIWHTSSLLHRVRALGEGAQPQRFVVVGAGQSAAESAAYLHRTFPQAEVHAVFSRYGYSPADDSAFANRIFDPAAVDDFYAAPEQVKRKLMDYHGSTNYSVVDLDLIDDLYHREYQEKVLGHRRLFLNNASRLVAAEPFADRAGVVIESLITGDRTALDADVVVYATGYHEADGLALLGDLAGLCLRDEQGRPQVDRDYRVRTTPELECGIYLQGGTEHSHGITSSLLSATAVRVGEMLDSIRARREAGTEAGAAHAGLAVPTAVGS